MWEKYLYAFIESQILESNSVRKYLDKDLFHIHTKNYTNIIYDWSLLAMSDSKQISLLHKFLRRRFASFSASFLYQTNPKIIYDGSKISFNGKNIKLWCTRPKRICTTSSVNPYRAKLSKLIIILIYSISFPKKSYKNKILFKIQNQK